MKNKTQEKQVIERLLQDGEVTRNWALSNYISRLGAIMLDLKKEGWNFNSFFRKTERGKDYVYKLEGDQPKKLDKVYVNGELVATRII